jgi:hypothetical protein
VRPEAAIGGRGFAPVRRAAKNALISPYLFFQTALEDGAILAAVALFCELAL